MINNPKVWIPLWYSFLFHLSTPLVSQSINYLLPKSLISLEDFIQAYLESRNEESGADLESLMDRLEALKQNPINLQLPGQPDLDDFILLTPLQINALRAYILRYGALLSIFELQVVPGFDVETIRMISPFIRLDSLVEPGKLNLREVWSQGENQLLLRSNRILEPQTGYQTRIDKTTYEGDPYKYYFKFLHQYANRFSFSIQGEKDQGETFLRGTNSMGFDFYSYHLGFRRLNKVIDELILGDFSVSLGQGLLMQSGFGVNKNAMTTSIQRAGRILKPFTSSNEFSYFRGLAGQFRLNNKLSLVVFYSNRNKDGNVTSDSTVFSSFQESGYHRTPGEIEDEKRIHEVVFGQAIKYTGTRGSIGLNSMSAHFDHYYLKSGQLYNFFGFKGDQLSTMSVDYKWQLKNLMFFGEYALAKSGANAGIYGLQWSLDKNLDLAILYRNLGKNYPGLYSGAFSENTLANNEYGIYLGLEWKPGTRWKIAAYQDYWGHPWYKFNVTGPSLGREYFIRMTYTLKRKLESYLQYKSKIRQENHSSKSPLENLNTTVITHWRAQFNYFWSKSWETRTRVEYSIYHSSEQNDCRGVLFFLDVLYHPMQSRLTFTSRLAWFNISDYKSRIYAYENDILGNFSVPAFNDTGLRFYLNLRFDVTRRLMVEGRWARTRLFDQSTLGTGLDEIQGNRRTELKVQLRWKF